MSAGNKPYVSEVTKITNFQDYFNITAAAAAKIKKLIVVTGGDGECVIAHTNAAINSSLSDYANFPLNSVIYSNADDKIYYKVAAAGTSTWKSATLS